MTRDEIGDLLATADVSDLPEGDVTAEDILEHLTAFEAKRLCGHVGREMANALKRSGLSRAAGEKTTPMHEACRWDNAEALRAVATVKNCQRKNKQGYRPLEVAVRDGSVECVRVLLEKHADPTRATPTGSTALHMAATCGGPALKVLIEHCRHEGIDIDVRDEHGRTPLMMAVAFRRDIPLFDLLKHGASASATTEDGRSPLSIARDHGFDDMAEILETLG